MKLGDLEFNKLPMVFGIPLHNRLMLDHHPRKLHHIHRIPSQNHRKIPRDRWVVVSCKSSLSAKTMQLRLSHVGWKVDGSAVRVENLRQFGGPWLALHLIRVLQLDTFLDKEIPEG